MIKARFKKIDLQFITPGQTSRGILYSKPSWFIILEKDGNTGIGECSVIPGLNPEFDDEYEMTLNRVLEQLNMGVTPALSELDYWPSIRFGLESALLDLQKKPQGILFPGEFTDGKKGIPINGLIWMGNKNEMQLRIAEKLDNGFRVLKLKVGALDFDEEISLLRSIRHEFPASVLEIRLDANGAFSPAEAKEKLKKLSDYNIHSVEQPIRAGQWEHMAEICQESPIHIALDEELIGIYDAGQKRKMLVEIKPQYIILKPGLLGGMEKSNEWIAIAESMNTGWWVTSALESNIGLNVIAQWTFTLKSDMVQGLGTGQVFQNNIPSPLTLIGPELFYQPKEKWLMINY